MRTTRFSCRLSNASQYTSKSFMISRIRPLAGVGVHAMSVLIGYNSPSKIWHRAAPGVSGSGSSGSGSGEPSPPSSMISAIVLQIFERQNWPMGQSALVVQEPSSGAGGLWILAMYLRMSLTTFWRSEEQRPSSHNCPVGQSVSSVQVRLRAAENGWLGCSIGSGSYGLGPSGVLSCVSSTHLRPTHFSPLGQSALVTH